MKAFRVTGHFQMGHNKKQPFSKQFAVDTEEIARERVLSDLGSRHGVGRRSIQITKVEVMTNEEEFDPVVRHQMAASGA